MKIFQKYSDYYDIIYKDKDYKRESDFIGRLLRKFAKRKVKSILSLGCGTCGHELILAKKGYKLTGVDTSQKMLEKAKRKIEENGLGKKIKLKNQDIRSLKLGTKYDFAMAMFNVVGYMTENKDILGLFKGVNKHLKKGALFVFDYWHTPAVLGDRPHDRIKEVTDGDRRYIRLTKSNIDLVKNVISINFKIMVIKGTKIITEVEELHKNRYWTIPELECYLNIAGFKLVNVCDFLNFEFQGISNNWNIFIIAEKV